MSVAAFEEVTEPSYLGGMLRAALAAAGVAFFFTGIDDYANKFGSGPSPQLVLILFTAAAVGLTLIEPKMHLPLLRSPFALWLTAFVIITLTWGIWMRHSTVADEFLRGRFRSFAMLVSFALIFSAPSARRMGVTAVAAAVVLASVLNVAEFLRLIEFAKDAELGVTGRSSNLQMNPNVAAMVIVLGVGASVGSLPERFRFPLIGIAAVGILTTFSRGGEVCFAFLVVLLLWRRQLRASVPVLLAVTLGALFAATLQADRIVSRLESREILNERTLARLEFETGDSGRTELAMKALNMFLESPLVGKGLAATVDWDDRVNSSHNQFLNLAGDHGVLGLLLFPALGLALMFRNPRAIPFAATLMLGGMVSHNLLTERAYLLVIALAASFWCAQETPEEASLEAAPRLEPRRAAS